MKMPDTVVSPWQLVTIKIKTRPGWRFRWSLGFWLIRAGSALLGRVELSLEGSGPRAALAVLTDQDLPQ